MPAIITHQVLGLELYEKLAPLIGESVDERDAFLLGNIGPDPLYCLRMLPHGVPYRDLGALMHREKPNELLCAFHDHYIKREQDAEDGKANGGRESDDAKGTGHSDVLRAYAMGFLCHYLADSMIHPLVYAQQYAMCDSGVMGLDREHGGAEVHTVIETELDEYVLTTRLGKTVASYVPHKEILKCSANALMTISWAMPLVVHDVYDSPMLPTSFRSSVKIYRAAQVTLDSKRDGLRTRIDYAKLVVNQYHHILLFTHEDGWRDASTYINANRFSWPHPFEPDAFVSDSFDDLYEATRRRALTLLPRFAEPSFSHDDCAAIANGLNFRGQRVCP